MLASCNHGYVFIDEDGDMLNLFPIASRSGDEAMADAALTENGYRRTAPWSPGRTHGELVATIER